MWPKVRVKVKKVKLPPQTRRNSKGHVPNSGLRQATATMKIYSISVLLAPPASKPTLLSNANYLSRQEAISDEFMTSLCEAVAETTSQGQRQSIHKDDCTAHIYNHGGPEQLAGVFL